MALPVSPLMWFPKGTGDTLKSGAPQAMGHVWMKTVLRQERHPLHEWLLEELRGFLTGEAG